MKDLISRVPTPIIVGIIIILIVCALLAIVKRAIKLGITLMIIVIMAILAMPYVNKVKESQFITELNEGVESVQDNMSSLFDEEEDIQ